MLSSCVNSSTSTKFISIIVKLKMVASIHCQTKSSIYMTSYVVSVSTLVMEQEQTLLANQDGVYIPTETEVLIVVGPKRKDIKMVKTVSAQLIASTLIILLNSRPSLLSHLFTPSAISKASSSAFLSELPFDHPESVFHYWRPFLPASAAYVSLPPSPTVRPDLNTVGSGHWLKAYHQHPLHLWRHLHRLRVMGAEVCGLRFPS